MTTPEIDEQGRPEPPLAQNEEQTLLGFLEYLRATIEWKTRGLSTEQIRTVLPPSSMTLVGLLKHLAYVEDFWFGRVIAGQQPSEPWLSVDWAANPDWEWDTAVTDSPDDVRQLWRESVAQSRQIWSAISEHDSFDLSHIAPNPAGDREISFRWVLTHMIEEYARHCGHADLMREALDGQTGE